MLENASKDYYYKLYVMQSDITQENKNLLFDIVEQFENASLEFIDMEGEFAEKFQDIFEGTKTKAYFSKEMYYKLITPSIFPQYDKLIVSDVDVVYLGDISQVYNDLDTSEDYYFSSKKSFEFDKRLKELELSLFKDKLKDYTEEEKEKTKYCSAGFMVYNQKKMKKDNIEQQLLEFIEQNKDRLFCPEQHTLALVCYPHIKPMPDNALVCTCDYKFYKDKLNKNYRNYDIIKSVLDNPIQLHYATERKPWNTYCEKADVWYTYLAKTPMFEVFMKKLLIPKTKKKVLFSFKTPLIERKFSLIKEKRIM